MTSSASISPRTSPGSGGTTDTDPCERARLRAVLVYEASGSDPAPFLLVAADSALIDLSSAERSLGKQLRVASVEEQQAWCEQQGVSVPVAALGNDARTVVDSALLEFDTIEIPRPGAVDSLDMLAFARAIKGMHMCNVSAPAPGPGEHDAADIEHAVTGFTQLRIQQRLDETLNMPPLPDAAQRIIVLQSDPDFDLSDISGIIETDPSLAAQVVGWANSPYYGAQGTVVSIDDAIMRVLGFDAVINMVLGLALGGALKVPNDPRPGVSPYWLQAVFTATAVEGLIRVMRDPGYTRVGLGYLAGLLNNFGYLVLAHVFPGHFERIARLATANDHLELEQIDRFVIGVSRNQLAAALFENWSLPEVVTEAVRWQNHPERASEDARPYAELLYMATHLLRTVGVSSGPAAAPIGPHHYASLDIDPDTGAAIVDKVIESADEIGAIARQIASAAG